VPGDDGVDSSVGQVVQHPLMAGPWSAGVGAYVVVDVLLGDGPSQACGQLAAVAELSSHSGLAAIAVL
jgi:hypothetical protein